MNYFAFHFQLTGTEQGEILLALLSDAGFSGFEEGEDELKAFIAEDAFDEKAFETILQQVPVSFTRSIIPPQNWNAQWESSFEPIRVHDLALVRASFHPHVEGVKYDIIITPKMSFGTGHHATTFLMMEQMEGLDLQGKKVLDFGTGTGLLAILAAKMGAGPILAIDNDDWSIENARENIAANDCPTIRLEKRDTVPEGETYGVILANINRNVLLANMPAIGRLAAPGAQVLLSGFMEEDCGMICDAAAENGFTGFSLHTRGEWRCMGMIKQEL